MIRCRQVLPGDHRYLFSIEGSSFDPPMAASRLSRLVEGVGRYGVLAFVDDAPAGYAAYGLTYSSLRILRLVVRPEFRRMGVAGAMLNKLSTALEGARTVMVAFVPDDNLPMHLCLRANGFRAEEIAADYYVFRYREPDGERSPMPRPTIPIHRGYPGGF